MNTTIIIEINGQPYDVHHETRTGSEIKAIARQEHGTLFRLEAEHRRLIENDEIVHLHEHERFEIANEEHVTIIINVDDADYPVHHKTRTGAEIKHLAGRPAGNTLYRIEGLQRIKIGDAETVHLHEHEHFITMPPVGHAA